MARQLRVILPGAFYHVMNRGNNGDPIFLDEDDKALFMSLLVDEIERCGLELHDYAWGNGIWSFQRRRSDEKRKPRRISESKV